MIQPEALEAIRAGRAGVHITTPRDGHVYEAVAVIEDEGFPAVRTRHLNGEDGPVVPCYAARALERTYGAEPPEPAWRLLAGRVEVLVSMDARTGYSRDNRVIYAAVDRHGHVEVRVPSMSTDPADRQARNREAAELLQEIEFAALRPVGPEDSELFLTARARAVLADQLAPLAGDWQEWDPDA